MNRALSGLQITKGSVITVALSLVAALCVSPYSGYLPDGQITFKWIGAGIAFCATVIIEILFSCTGTSKRTGIGSDAVIIRTIAIPFLAAFLIVTIHSLLQVTGAVPVNSHNGFRVLAGFDNPAGAASAMAVSFPFVLALADRLKDSRIRYAVMCGAFCVIIMILAIARSRVGILAAGVVMVLWAIHANNNVRAGRIVAAILAVLVIAAVVYMSFHKRGSNSGRALSLFSYPFRYPLTVLGLLCALVLVYKDVLLRRSLLHIGDCHKTTRKQACRQVQALDTRYLYK